MKNIIKTILLLSVVVLCAGCGNRGALLPLVDPGKDFSALRAGSLFGGDGILRSTYVEGTLLNLNAAYTGRPVEGAGETCWVLQGPFWISASTISRDEVARVAGSRAVRGGLLSWDDIQGYLKKLRDKTGLPFDLPTESEWEAALAAGVIPYGGGAEWTCEGADGVPPKELQENYHVPVRGGGKVILRTSGERQARETFVRTGDSFRIVLRVRGGVPSDVAEAVKPDGPQTRRPAPVKPTDFSVEVKDNRIAPVRERYPLPKDAVGSRILFRMIPVQGGSARLGGTEEQEKYAEGDETPVREVRLADFAIGEKEVSAELWLAVMGSLPGGNDYRHLDRPVVGVSWYAAKQFIIKLNHLTGEYFRLPEEDEWEWAARGGVKSRGYVLSGGNPPRVPAVYTTRDDKSPSLAPCGSKGGNELGLCDMSGNAWEWVQGTYEGPDGYDWCVARGGSHRSHSAACRVSNRQGLPPATRKDTFGFRLAL